MILRHHLQFEPAHTYSLVFVFGGKTSQLSIIPVVSPQGRVLWSYFPNSSTGLTRHWERYLRQGEHKVFPEAGATHEEQWWHKEACCEDGVPDWYDVWCMLISSFLRFFSWHSHYRKKRRSDLKWCEALSVRAVLISPYVSSVYPGNRGYHRSQRFVITNPFLLAFQLMPSLYSSYERSIC